MTLRDTILAIASRQRQFRSSDVLRALDRRVSRQYVNVIIGGLVQEGALIKGGSTRGAYYALPKHAMAAGRSVKKRLTNRSLTEDDVLDDLKRRAPFLAGLRPNVNNIFSYAFLEMLNNAIEHSTSQAIEVEVTSERKQLTFVVNDFGVGVFRNVMKRRNLNSELEAIQDLLKGKTTTQPEAHSGEGIFFTSKVGDLFILESFKYRLRVDNLIEDYFIEELDRSKRGTRVTLTISEESTRQLNDVFRKYQVDQSKPGFDKSEIKVKLYAMGTEYVSRSQARRLLSGLDKFRTIVLDFNHVRTIGQGFADEILRVFRRQYPDIAIQTINVSDPVKFMLDRAREK